MKTNNAIGLVTFAAGIYSGTVHAADPQAFYTEAQRESEESFSGGSGGPGLEAALLWIAIFVVWITTFKNSGSRLLFLFIIGGLTLILHLTGRETVALYLVTALVAITWFFGKKEVKPMTPEKAKAVLKELEKMNKESVVSNVPSISTENQKPQNQSAQSGQLIGKGGYEVQRG